VAHSYMWYASLVRDMTHSCVTWRICVWHDAFVCDIERVCVCDREGVRVCACVCVWRWVCVYVCVGERKRWGVCEGVCVWKRESVCER